MTTYNINNLSELQMRTILHALKVYNDMYIGDGAAKDLQHCIGEIFEPTGKAYVLRSGEEMPEIILNDKP